MKPEPSQPMIGMNVRAVSTNAATTKLTPTPTMAVKKLSDVLARLHNDEYICHNIMQKITKSRPKRGNARIRAPQNA